MAPLSPPARDPGGRAVVIGGINLDIKARTRAPSVMRTSNPGDTTTSPGGVARNIAENLARLGTTTELAGAVGSDEIGARLLDETRDAGVGVGHVLRLGLPTGTYTACLDADGELLVGVADMSATEAVRPDHVTALAATIGSTDLLVLDANLAVDTIDAAIGIARDHGVRVLIDPVGAPKAAMVGRVLEANQPVFAITPDRAELAALAGTSPDDPLERAAAILHGRNVRIVWVSLGEAGSILYERGAPPLTTPARAAAVVDVTGAGDAMVAAFAHAVLVGRTLAEATVLGHAAAALTVESRFTVRPDLGELLTAREGD